mgnify:CR=1 FL=1
MNTTPIRKRVIDMEVGETITIPVASNKDVKEKIAELAEKYGFENVVSLVKEIK